MDNREFDEDEPDERLYSFEELMVDESDPFVKEIEDGILSEAGCEALVEECLREFNTSRRKTSEENLDESDSARETRTYPVNMWTPNIDSVEIESYEHLLYIIASKSPEFFKRTDAAKLLESARLHLELHEEYNERESLKQGEVADLSRKLEKNPTSLKRYLREGVMPRMYYWLNKVPSDVREKNLDSLIERLNGVTTHEEYDRRFNKLYFNDEMSTTPDHQQYDEFAQKFLSFINEYEDGGLIADLTKKFGIGKSTIGAWFDGTQLPTRIAYASLIPKEDLSEGLKWLPKKLNHITNLPEDFIQVPTEVNSPQDLLDVLGQIAPLESEFMEKYKKVNGELSRPTAFMYLLGLMVSDGSFVSDVDFSASANLFVSKKYSWCSTLGEGFQYTLGRIGLSARRRSDSEKLKENGKIDVCQVYSSEASPLLMWMKKTLLGMKTSEIKKHVPIKADWILNTPSDWKVAFIQGLADGDGYASIPRFDTAITTITNQEFFVELLSSVGIESTNNGNRAEIAKYDEILKARELPLFRYATGRQKRLDDICGIIELRPGRRYRIPEREKQLVRELYESGLSAGQITERLWYDYGMARPTSTIERIISLENKKKIRNADSDN